VAGSEFMTISVSVLCQLITMAPSCTFLKNHNNNNKRQCLSIWPFLAIFGHFVDNVSKSVMEVIIHLELSQFNYVSAMFDAGLKQSLSLCNLRLRPQVALLSLDPRPMKEL